MSSSAAPPLPAVFQRYQPHLDAAMRERLAEERSFVYAMLRYNMGWSDVEDSPAAAPQGKALRPTLCLLACEAVCDDFERAIPAAVALEFIHNFSLIHDEIQDRDEVRRHRPTLWTVWGDAKALTAGNVMRIVADSAIEDLAIHGASQEDVLAVSETIAASSLEMIEGQYLDLTYEGRTDIGMQYYLDMIARKTGTLIRAPMHIGAILGSGREDVVRAFLNCGRALGYVFQIRDDALGVWGEEETTGKRVGADIRRRKNSLPIVHAMSKANAAQKRTLSRVYAKESVTDDDVEMALGIMDDLGARNFVHSMAAEYCERAMEWLAPIELPHRSRAEIEALSEFLLHRRF